MTDQTTAACICPTGFWIDGCMVHVRHPPTAQPLADRITALLPDHTHVQAEAFGIGGKTWTWTTPAGTWAVTAYGLGGILRLVAPNGELHIGGDDDTRWRKLVGVLRALGAMNGAGK